jgi:alkanesulfonate monooxygenase SsuD/methylene tetrahydromethanopterin reductase-like flavin-dependent oxidoreductase (luciferase family)
MRLGAGTGRADDPGAVRSRARAYEDAGVDVLWAAELYSFDAVSMLGFLAAVTSRAARAVPDELVEGTALIGPAGYVRERLAAYREAGVTLLTVRPAGPDPDPERMLSQLREWM